MASPMPGTPQSDFSVAVAKDRLHNCRAKDLLYGGNRPETPKAQGKKSLGHASNGTPYATNEAGAPGPVEPRGATLQQRKKQEGAGKVGHTGDFDPNVYLANRASNQASMQALRTRNRGGNGVMCNDPVGPEEPLEEMPVGTVVIAPGSGHLEPEEGGYDEGGRHEEGAASGGGELPEGAYAYEEGQQYLAEEGGQYPPQYEGGGYLGYPADQEPAAQPQHFAPPPAQEGPPPMKLIGGKWRRMDRDM